MSWYIHPTKQLRDDELPPELVVTNRDGSIEQVYVPYNASDQLKAENAKLWEENDKLREECNHWHVEQVHAFGNWEDAHKKAVELESENARLHELLQRTWDAFHNASSKEFNAVKRDLREQGIEVDE